MDRILTSNNIVETANEAVIVLTDENTRSLDECTCALKNIERSIVMADALILSSQNEILTIRAQLVNDPHNEFLLATLAGLELELEGILSAAVYIKAIGTEVIAALQIEIDLLNGELLDIIARLKANVNLLDANLITLAVDLDMKLRDVVNFNEFKIDLSNIIGVLRNVIEGVEIHLLGLDLDGVFKVLFGFNDHNVEGYSATELTHVHEQIIKSAVGACACNNNVQVIETPSYKRSTGTKYEYTVMISDVPASSSATVDRATEENGMTATTATTSSASSLVSSFLILFVSVLCFF
jgi:hypothetical protein